MPKVNDDNRFENPPTAVRPARHLRALTSFALVLFASATVIGGCSSEEKYVIIDPQPEGITIQHDSRYGSMAGVDADEHCAKYGKVAVFDRTIKPDEGTLLLHPEATQSVFDCVAATPAK